MWNNLRCGCPVFPPLLKKSQWLHEGEIYFQNYVTVLHWWRFTFWVVRQQRSQFNSAFPTLSRLWCPFVTEHWIHVSNIVWRMPAQRNLYMRRLRPQAYGLDIGRKVPHLYTQSNFLYFLLYISQVENYRGLVSFLWD